MKFILFDIKGSVKNEVHDVCINDKSDDILKEIIFSKDFVNFLRSEPKGIFKKIKFKLMNKKFNKIIKKSLANNKFKWYYIFSNNYGKDEKDFLKVKLQSLLGYEYLIKTEMEINLDKYIKEYININDKKQHDIKLLLVYNLNKNINLFFIKSLIEKYKFVNIFLNEKPSNYILKQISKINNTYGTTIEFVKSDKKVFKDYDIIYYVGIKRDNFSKFRFNRNSLIIDSSTELDDKYNTNIMYLNDYIKLCGNEKIIENLIKNYGKLEAATIIKNLK